MTKCGLVCSNQPRSNFNFYELKPTGWFDWITTKRNFSYSNDTR